MMGLNESTAKYIRSMSEMTENIRGIYFNSSYMEAVQNAQRMASAIRGVYDNPGYMKVVESARRMVETLNSSIPNLYYNPSLIKSTNRILEALSNSKIYSDNAMKSMLSSISKAIEPQMILLNQNNILEITRRHFESVEFSSQNLSFMMKNLQEAISNSEELYDNSVDWEIDDSEISESIEFAVTGNLSQDEIEERNKKSGGGFVLCLKNILIWLMVTILSGYIQYAFQPIYETADRILLKKEANKDSINIGYVEPGSKITIHSNKDGYTEISCEYEDGVVQGYAEKREIDNNTKVVYKSLSDDEVVFVANCMMLMSEYWDVDLNETNERLNVKYNIVRDYIVPNYNKFSEMDFDELADNISQEYNSRVSKQRK